MDSIKGKESPDAINSNSLINPENKSKPHFDEQKIWNDFRKGSELAYVSIYEYGFDILIQFGCQICNNIELIEDTIQDVFVDLRIKRKNLPEIKYSLKYYLIKAFRNKLIRYIDREKWLTNLHKTSAYDSFQFVKSSEQIMISNQDFDAQRIRLEKATKSLTPKEREAIYYYYYLNLSYEEVKEIFEMKSIKATRNLVYRAIKHLRSILSN